MSVLNNNLASAPGRRALSVLRLSIVACMLIVWQPSRASAQEMSSTSMATAEVISADFRTERKDAGNDRLGLQMKPLSLKDEPSMPMLNRRISIDLQGATLEEALDQIMSRGDVRLAYLKETVAVDKHITLHREGVTVWEALGSLLEGTGLRLTLSPGGQLILRKGTEGIAAVGSRLSPLLPGRGPFAPNESALRDLPVQGVISGVVTDTETGLPLPGANVVIVGTMQGTVTDRNGRYRIPGVEPGTYDLRASFVGYLPQLVEDVQVADGQTTVIDFELETDTVLLDEVVAVGYGVQQKSDVTGAVSSIQSEDFNEGVNTSVEQLIQGKVPGVQISQTTGDPGGGMSIQIRGVGSINAGTQPLYVIDGVPIDNTNMLSAGGVAQLSADENPRNPLNTINPGDIESVEILKDASATAIYGSRAANGVVLITTKKGTIGRPRVTFNSRVGTQAVAKRMDLLSPAEYVDVINGISIDRGEGPVFGEDYLNQVGPGTDWQDQILRQATTLDNDLSISGGSESTTYYLSFSQLSQEGVVQGSGLETYSFRTNLNSNITDRIESGFNLTAARVNNDNIAEGVNINEQGGPIYTSMLYDPTLPVFDEDGSYFRSPHLTINNPVSLIEGIKTTNVVGRFLGNAFLRYQLTDQLQSNLNVGYDAQSDKRDIYNSTLTIHGQANNGIAHVGTLNRSSILAEFTTQYDGDINANNHLQVLGGVTYQDFDYETFSGQISNFPTDDIRTYNLSLGDISSANLVSSRERSRLLSYLGRLNYRLIDRYLFTGSIRADGSSRFGENYRYGIFPSLALAWNIDEEAFMPEFFSELKLRVSWGVTGNQEIGNYNTQLSFVSGPDAVLGGQRVGSLIPSRVANPDLKWERTEQYNIGVDVGILEDRVSGSAEFFIKSTNDMLILEPLPLSSGFASRLTNLEDARIENTGFEFGLRSVNVSTQDVTWRTNLSLSLIRNTVKELGGIKNILIGNLQNVGSYGIVREGDPIAAYYGYEITGIFQEGDDIAGSAQPGAKPGYPIVRDTDGDGAITAADRVILGDPHPDAVIGLQNSLTYGPFQLDVFFDAKLGYELLNMNLIETLYPHNFRRNRFAEPYLNRWTPTNTDTKWPSGTFPSEYSGGKVNSLTVEDASFIRLRYVTLRYQLPQSWVRNASISITGQNLFTLTDYSGFNPEANAFGRSIGRVDFNTYPLARTVLFGVTLGF